ncbi:MAG: sodium:solute symporter [Firmicutes bacterium HGW-Firmicutes-1]|jgi:SSS family solute:Na+ symporter|nr:MAG: sodium:solute symporter [Firmicutes bacterium HGW-Firmicutes-1]
MTLKVLFTFLYLGVTGYLGYLGYRHTKNSKDYMIGGREIHPMVMALSYGATFISTSAIIGFGGTSALFGMSLLWLTFMNIFFGIMIAFILFGKRTRKMGHNLDAHTFPEFIGRRYQSVFIQKFAGSVIFFLMPVYTAAVMIGAAKFIEWSLGVNYNAALFFFAIVVAIYVFFGGIKGVMYSDAFQGSLMFIGMAILLISVYHGLGGVSAAHQKLTNLMSNPAVLEQLKVPPGFNGWTAMPTFLSTNWWVVVSSIVMGVGIGVLAQPQLVVRFMTVKSNREINRAVPAGGVFILMMTGVAFIVGPLSNVYFFEKFGQIAVVAAKGTDNVIPVFLQTFMPEWFMAVFFVVVVAAGMSTISSQFHAIGTAVGRDLFPPKDDDEKKLMLVMRGGMLVAILITMLLAYILPTIWDGAIAISTGLFFGVCAAAFLPLYVGALYFKKLSKVAAVSGMCAGFITSVLWMMFIHTKESAVLKICSLLFGKDTLVPAGNNLAVVDPIIISLAISILVTLVVAFMTKSKFENKHIDTCFNGIK